MSNSLCILIIPFDLENIQNAVNQRHRIEFV